MIARGIDRAVTRSLVLIARPQLITVPSSAIKSCTGGISVRGLRMVTRMDLEVTSLTTHGRDLRTTFTRARSQGRALFVARNITLTEQSIRARMQRIMKSEKSINDQKPARPHRMVVSEKEALKRMKDFPKRKEQFLATARTGKGRSVRP